MEKQVGTVIRYYAAGRVAEVKLIGTLRVGDHICIRNQTTDFEQTVTDMYIGQKPLKKAVQGQTIWLGAIKRVHEGDKVFLILEEPDGPGPDGPEPDGPDKPDPPPKPPHPDYQPPDLESNGDDEDDDGPELPDWNDFYEHRRGTHYDKGGGAGG